MPRKKDEPSINTRAFRELTDAAVAEAIAIITPWVKANPARLLKTLQKPELESLCQAIATTWTSKAAEMPPDEIDKMLNDSIDDLFR